MRGKLLLVLLASMRPGKSVMSLSENRLLWYLLEGFLGANIDWAAVRNSVPWDG